MKTECNNGNGQRKEMSIGSFRVVSGRLVVSDPCYEIGAGSQGFLEKVRKGEWVCRVTVAQGGDFDKYIMELTAHRSRLPTFDDLGWTKETPFYVDVDSGQAGIFDMAHYRDDRIAETVQRLSDEEICPEEPWYSVCCDRTMSGELGAGIIPYGVVSSSGFGDGSYQCFTQRDSDGYVIGVKIVFIKDLEVGTST